MWQDLLVGEGDSLWGRSGLAFIFPTDCGCLRTPGAGNGPTCLAQVLAVITTYWKPPREAFSSPSCGARRSQMKAGVDVVCLPDFLLIDDRLWFPRQEEGSLGSLC